MAICLKDKKAYFAKDALSGEKVHLDENIWMNVLDVLSRYPGISSVPILDDDDRLLYFAEDSLEWTEWMMRLCALEKEDAIWQNISAVQFEGCNEAFVYFNNFLQEKGIQVFGREQAWEAFGVSTDWEKCPEDAWTIKKDGEEINRLYAELSEQQVWEAFCREIKEKESGLIFCCAPCRSSEKLYNVLLHKGILPKAVCCMEEFHTLYGEKAISIRDIEGEVYCLTGRMGDVHVGQMFETVMRRQNGYCGNIYLLSEIGDRCPDTMLRYMIRYCGKVVLMGEKRLCGMLQQYYDRSGTEVVYVDGKEQIEAGLCQYVDALWFWLDFPSKESSLQYKDYYEALKRSGIYLSRYFYDHYMYYEDAECYACFTQDELDEMACLRNLQTVFDESRKDISSDREREILFYASHYSYFWGMIESLFQYYMKQGNARCIIAFPSIWEIATIGRSNLKKITEIVSDIRNQGGQVGLYVEDWYLHRKYDVCYVPLSHSPWHFKKGVFRISKAIIAIQLIAYHTHYYQGNQTFEEMFSEHHRTEIDGAVVSAFMAEWAGQKEEKWREKFIPLGYPKMDSLYKELKTGWIPEEWKTITRGKKVIFSTLYSPNLFRICYPYCEDDKAVLIWRPHPLWFEVSHEKEREIIEEWRKKKNVIIDDNLSYAAAFCCSDAMISAFIASVQVNYLFTDKPVLILDKGYFGLKEKNKIAFQDEAWYRAAYTANSEKECREFLEMVLDGRDDKKEEKMPYRQLMQQGFDGKVCQRIAEFVEKEYDQMRYFW